ncbi:MAG: hypothetical protein ACLP7Q_15870 [Isosphaeraceae bacterium]
MRSGCDARQDAHRGGPAGKNLPLPGQLQDWTISADAFGTALPALAAATKVWRNLFPDALDLCRDGLAFVKKHQG